MTPNQMVAVTGATGRLGSAILRALRERGGRAVAWSRPEYDLDVAGAGRLLLERDRPDLVVHAAAWTDVDGCADDPARAMRRNATASIELATACAEHGTGLVLVSTNEVFDGRRTDGLGYRESDPTSPGNAYGVSKLAAEQGARVALGHAAAPLWIVRTSWLYGPPGADFPAKILAAAGRLATGQPLRVVVDEHGVPTRATDLATAILELTRVAPPGTYHLVDAGHTTRAGWAERVLRAMGREVPIEPIRQADFPRRSRPPAWGVLDTSLAAGWGVTLPRWEDAVDQDAAERR